MSSSKFSVESMKALDRRIEKHLSREFDQFYIEQGYATEQAIAIKNDFFHALNLRKFTISSIGRRPAHAR
ncbi:MULTISPECIES: hypothetical protein [unclassified Bradyrhizobium]|uniref:hypothetical protein n=1 Tax=unclassified Bradyrhizobium TaxID=2631580 RepID=UPI0028E85BD5|nr:MULTISPECIES: hypothetical protein [unclassified Bradyrhizobium]